MGGQFGVGGKFDSLISSLSSNRGRVGDDERDDEFAPIAQDHGIENVGAGLESVFDGLRGDEFAGGGFQQVFFSVGDEEIAVFVHVADVAGAEPAIFAEYLAGGFGILVVALHDAGALH